MSETLGSIDSAEEPQQTFEIEERVTGWVFSEGRFASMQLGLLYARNDPVCATLRFYKPDGETEADWNFSRALLAWGYHEPAGEGNVIFESHDPNYLGVHINPPDDVEAYVYVPRPTVKSYLDQTYALVSVEQEQAMIDQAFDQWAEGELQQAPQGT